MFCCIVPLAIEELIYKAIYFNSNIELYLVVFQMYFKPLQSTFRQSNKLFNCYIS